MSCLSHGISSGAYECASSRSGTAQRKGRRRKEDLLALSGKFSGKFSGRFPGRFPGQFSHRSPIGGRYEGKGLDTRGTARQRGRKGLFSFRMNVRKGKPVQVCHTGTKWASDQLPHNPEYWLEPPLYHSHPSFTLSLTLVRG